MELSAPRTESAQGRISGFQGHDCIFGGDHGGEGGHGMCFLLAGTTEAKAGTACFSFGGEHEGDQRGDGERRGGGERGGGDQRRRLVLARRRLRLARRRLVLARRRLVLARRRLVLARRRLVLARRRLFLARRRIFFGTAEVILHRRRDLRAGRLPLRLFGSDRNDDSQFSSRLALRR